MNTVALHPRIRFVDLHDFVPREGERIPDDSHVSIWSDIGSSTTTVQFPLPRRWRGVPTLEPVP